MSECGFFEVVFTGCKSNSPVGVGCSSPKTDSEKVTIRGVAFQNAWENAGHQICADGTIQFAGKVENDCFARNLAEEILKSEPFKKSYESLAASQKEAAISATAKLLSVIGGKNIDEFRAWSSGIKCGAGFYGNYVPNTITLPFPKSAITKVLAEAKKLPDGSCVPADIRSHYALIEGYKPPVAIVGKPVDLGKVGVIYSGPKAVEPGDCHLESQVATINITQKGLTVIPLKDEPVKSAPAVVAQPVVENPDADALLENIGTDLKVPVETKADPKLMTEKNPTIPFKAVEIKLGLVTFSQAGRPILTLVCDKPGFTLELGAVEVKYGKPARVRTPGTAQAKKNTPAADDFGVAPKL